MAFTIIYKRQAVEDARKLKSEEPKAFQKLLKLESELRGPQIPQIEQILHNFSSVESLSGFH